MWSSWNCRSQGVPGGSLEWHRVWQRIGHVDQARRQFRYLTETRVLADEHTC